MRKKLNIFWNVISGLAVLYLTLLSCSYIANFILDGAIETLTCTRLSPLHSFVAMVSVIIVLIHVYDRIILPQFLRAREIIEERSDKRKKETMKKKSSK